jgi:hypothetical protein
MNAQSLLRFPWHWTYPSLRWGAVIAFVLWSTGAIAVGVFTDGPKALVDAMALYGAGLVYLWAFYFPLGLLVAIDARELRLPRIQRRIHASLVLYGLLGVALPLLAPGVDWSMAAVLALFTVCGLVLALIPRYLAMIFALVPALANALWSRLDLPGIGDQRFAPWAASTAAVLLLICVWRWWQLLRAGTEQPQGWASPMVLQFRKGRWGHWGGFADGQQQRPDWLRARVNLAGVGPARPRKAMQVMLGGWYLPQTISSHGKQLALFLGILVLPATSLLLISRMESPANTDFSATLTGSGFGALSSLSVMAAPMICIFTLLWLSKRWQRANAELPLMALLPGLGDTAGVKRQLVRTVLGMPLALHVLLVALLCAVMLFWHGHTYMLSFVLWAQLGGALVTVAVLLNLLGGRALSPWGIGLILVVASLLTLLSLLLPAFALGKHPIAQVLPLLPLLPLGWLLLAGAMVWLCRRGWRGLAQRPHPFLAD